MNESLLAFAISLIGISMANPKTFKGVLRAIRQCVVTWPMQQTVTILVLTVLGTAWVVSYIAI